jgi:hypothetical protein
MNSLLFFLAGFEIANAQVFPIQTTVQLTPPYSPYLSDYTAPGAQNIAVHINANDITIHDYLCRLRITIDGNNLTIKTRPSFIPQPIILQGGGFINTIFGEDIVDYFRPENMDFAGAFSRADLIKTGKLPEGIYKISVEVLDYNRGTVVSNKGFAMAWIILNDPPLLNMPANNFKIKIIDPTNIVFNWTPRNTGSPNAAFSTEYVFRLVEIWDNRIRTMHF